MWVQVPSSAFFLFFSRRNKRFIVYHPGLFVYPFLKQIISSLGLDLRAKYLHLIENDLPVHFRHDHIEDDNRENPFCDRNLSNASLLSPASVTV